MIARAMTASIRRRVPNCLWVDVRYCEPFGTPRWGVSVEILGGDNSPGHYLATGAHLLPTLCRAWLAARSRTQEDERIRLPITKGPKPPR